MKNDFNLSEYISTEIENIVKGVVKESWRALNEKRGHRKSS